MHYDSDVRYETVYTMLVLFRETKAVNVPVSLFRDLSERDIRRMAWEWQTDLSLLPVHHGTEKRVA